MISVLENFLFWKSVFFYKIIFVPSWHKVFDSTLAILFREIQSYYVNLSLALSGVNSWVEGREVNFA